MICVAVGSPCQMTEKEAQLLRDGYIQVVGPSPGPMEYCKQPEYSGKRLHFRLCWNQPCSTAQAHSNSTPSFNVE